MSGVTGHLKLLNHKSYGADILREGSLPPTCHVSCVMCHVSHVTCHVSHVTCHVSRVTCHMHFFYKEVKLVAGESVINGASPFRF